MLHVLHHNCCIWHVSIYLYSIQAHLIHNIKHHLGCNVRNQLVFSISTGSPYFVVINSIVPKTFWASYHDLIKRSFGILRRTISAGELFQFDHNVMEVFKSEDLGWQEPGRKKTVLRGGGFRIKTRRDRFFWQSTRFQMLFLEESGGYHGRPMLKQPAWKRRPVCRVEGNSASVVVVFVLVCLCLSLSFPLFLFFFLFFFILVLFGSFSCFCSGCCWNLLMFVGVLASRVFLPNCCLWSSVFAKSSRQLFRLWNKGVVGAPDCPLPQCVLPMRTLYESFLFRCFISIVIVFLGESRWVHVKIFRMRPQHSRDFWSSIAESLLDSLV